MFIPIAVMVLVTGVGLYTLAGLKMIGGVTAVVGLFMCLPYLNMAYNAVTGFF